MPESTILPNTNTVFLWMLVAITAVISAKVVTGTLLNQKRKEIYKICEKLFGVKAELDHHHERVKVAKDMISFAKRQKGELQHQIEITKDDLKAIEADEADEAGEDGEKSECADPSVPAHMRSRGEGLFD